MNRIGWFVVCFVLPYAISTSLADKSSIIDDSRLLKNATYAKPKIENIHSNLSLLGKFVAEFFGWRTGLQENGSQSQGRTFGQKRIQFMMMAPMMYKMGVMMTMLVVLTVISLKGLVIGAILLILKLSSFIAKFYVGWHPQGHGQIWPHQQPLHVHVHGQQAHNQAYNAWPPISDTISPDDHYYYKG